MFYAIRREHLKFCSRTCIDAKSRRNAHSYPKIGGRHAHRVVMERALGRSLGPDEIVHHDDENKLNYDRENLILTNRPDHMRHHVIRKQSPEHIAKRMAATKRTKQEKRERK